LPFASNAACTQRAGTITPVNRRVVVIGSALAVGDRVGTAIIGLLVGTLVGAAGAAVGGRGVIVGTGVTCWDLGDCCASSGVLIATGDWHADKANKINRLS
jgi:hypothetical protein